MPVYDKIAEIEDQIKDQKAKIQNAKAQIIKNDSTIRDLLMSVVTTKWFIKHDDFNLDLINSLTLFIMKIVIILKDELN